MRRTQITAGRAALVVAMSSLVLSVTGAADAARKAVRTHFAAGAVVRLDAARKIPAKALPKVAKAKDADTVGGQSADDLTTSCDPTSVDLGTYCLMASPYPLTNDEVGRNDFFFASKKCASLGGYLPSASQLIGAADQVKLASTIDDDQLTASIDLDRTDGLKDRREMSSTLITTAAGSSAAGSEGVTEGSKGDPKQGEPDPTPFPANPTPDTLQYVTVYDDHDAGGFAGGKPVTQPENFRCAFDKVEGASAKENG